jgi:hypothetical protein
LERALYRAQAAVALKQERLAELQWAQAIDHAARDSSALLLLASVAKGSQAWEVSERALRSLAEQRPFRRRSLQELVHLFDEQGNLARVRETLAELIKAHPEDTSARNDFAYVQILTGGEIEGACKIAEDLVKSRPDYLAFRSTLALGRLRLGDGHGARAVLEERAVDWTRALPAQKAIYAAVLGNAGEIARAREICGAIRVNSLKREEQALIASWL